LRGALRTGLKVFPVPLGKEKSVTVVGEREAVAAVSKYLQVVRADAKTTSQIG
jgi:hypothetical protein